MSRRPHRSAPTLRGFTLVEIMVAVTIGLIILAAVAQIFATSRASYGLQEDLARLQESGRFSMEFISQDVRMSGNLGCLKKVFRLGGSIVNPVKNGLNNPADYGWNFVPGEHLSGHTYTGGAGTALSDWTPPLPGTINGVTYFNAGDVSPNTDVFVVRRAREQSFKLMATAPQAGFVTIPPGNGLETGDIVLITDCNDGDIFQISAGTTPDIDGLLPHSAGAGTPGNADNNFSKSYGINSEVMPLVTRIYYVGPGIAGRPTLFRKEIDNGAVTTQPLVDDVEMMRVLYGEDVDTPTDNMANIYRQADAVTDWARVVSVRVGLLARTANESGPDVDTRTYNLAGITVDPTPATDDRRQRRVFTATVQLRNPI